MNEFKTRLKVLRGIGVMMKIAIWGYGKYGRRMFESLTRFCTEEYEVVRVYDIAYKKMVKTEGEQPLPILCHLEEALWRRLGIWYACLV